ncbi:MAG: PD-(D/E)XK nuclease family protein [Nitrospirota bacterium]|nr:PD-(D/E)XK nuclease family protein [Nitrospirota bacterium]
MVDILTGLPHPDLEQALVQRIQQYKTADPFASLLILVPSEFLRTQLVWRLCVEHDQPLFNVQVLTFFQLALRLAQENGQDVIANLRTDFVFKECVHQVLRQSHAALPSLRSLREIPGAWAALWATIKDLKDGTVDPDVALDALGQSEIAAQVNLESLFRLSKLVLDRKREFGMHDADDVAGLAVDAVPSSTFLKAQTNILYFGFYDLTQVQLDVFKCIAQCYPTTLFFPLIPRHAAFRFAQQFFDRHLCGLLTGPLTHDHSSTNGLGLRQLFAVEQEVEDDSGAPLGPECQIVEVSGVEDEIGFIAKAIRQHVEDQQVPFHDIAVVGRTLSGYSHTLPRVFAEHGIPLYSTMSRSLTEWPLVKLAIQLLDLRNGNFRREQVLDVVSSPFFNVTALNDEDQDLPSDQWDVITRTLGIQKGIHEWERLQSCLENAGSTDGDDLKDFGGSRTQLAALWKVVSALVEMLQNVPEQASLETYEAHAQHVISYLIKPSRFVDHPSLVSDFALSRQSARDQPDVDQQEILDALSQRLQDLRVLSPLCGEVPYLEFISMLKRLLEESMAPLHENTPKGEGVWVLDAMAARGLSFRVLFVMGLTENVFPRHIREDAFLRDEVRRWTNESLGYKVPEKLAGYDEEKLLFYLLVNSASKFLILLYQRSDQSGHPQIPSSYLNDVQRCLGSVLPVVVPRQLSQKCIALRQYETRHLTPREFRTAWLLKRHRPTASWKDGYAIGDVLEQGMTSLHAQESHRDQLGQYDGVTGFLPSFWTKLQEKGLSPTALETYARCPFQYFAKQVLGLQPLPIANHDNELEPREVGNLAHEVLTECFRALADQEYFSKQPQKGIDFHSLLIKRAEPIFEKYARTHAVGYPVLWDIQQQAVIELLYQVIQDDVDELGEEWAPVMFEESMKATLPVMLSEGPHELPITGRVDRIDWSAKRQVYRVIDYKFTDSSSRKASSTSLVLDVVRGSRLQPPFYLKLAEAMMPERLRDLHGEEAPAQMNCDNVWFYRMSPKVLPNGKALTRVSFPGDAWSSTLKLSLEKTINGFVDGIQRGHFFITPGPQCGWCEYRMACHRTHQLSAWRARVDQALIQPHRRLRQQKLPANAVSKQSTNP